MMSFRYVVALTLLVISTMGYAQNNPVVDSLKSVYASSASDEQKVDVLNLLADELWHVSPLNAAAYADSAYQLAQSANYLKGYCLALANKGVGAYTFGEYPDAEKFYLEALKLDSLNQFSYNTNIYYINLLKRQGRFDALIQFVENQIPESLKMDPNYLSTIASSFVDQGKVAEAKKYIKLILESSSYNTNELFRTKTNVLISDILILEASFDSAAKMLNDAKLTYELNNDYLGVAKVKNNLGELNLDIGDEISALDNFTSALAIYDSLNYLFGIAEAKHNLGDFYSKFGEYNRATTFLFDAVKIHERMQSKNELALVYNKIAWIYIAQELYDVAEKFVLMAVELSDQIDNHVTAGIVYNAYGYFFESQKKHAKAFEAYQIAYKNALEIGDERAISAYLYNMAYNKSEIDPNDENILKMYMESYNIDKEIGTKYNIVVGENTLGEYYLKEKNFDEAIKYLELARNNLKTAQYKSELLRNYYTTALLYETTKDYKKSNLYYKKYVELKDTLSDERMLSKVSELEIKYGLEKKEKEIALLNLEKKTNSQELMLKEEEIRSQRAILTFIVIGSGLLIIFLIIVFRLSIVRKKANNQLILLNREIQEKNEEIVVQAEELQEANNQINSMNEDLETKIKIRTTEVQQAYKELDTFFYRSSHDFAGPLTTFMGLTELAKVIIKDKEALGLFDKVGLTASRLSKMVKKLQSISLTGAVNLKLQEIDFDRLIEQTINKRNIEIEAVKLEIAKHVDISQQFMSYPELISLIIDNLLENSILYRNRNYAKIDFQIHSTTKGVRMIISDNGEGIRDELISKVFEMYVRASDSSSGNGLGLYLVKKAVDKLNGKLWLESEFGKGTTFKIELPNL